MKEDIRAFSTPVGIAPMYSPVVGVSYCDGTYHITRTKANITVIEYVISGEGYVRIGGKRYAVGKDTIYILPKGMDQEYWSSGENPWVKIFVNFRGDLPGILLREYGFGETYIFPGDGYRTYFAEVENVLTSEEPEDVLQAKLTAFFVKVIALLRGFSVEATLSEEAITLREYLVDNMDRIVTNQELAAQIYRSVDYCVKLFGRDSAPPPTITS